MSKVNDVLKVAISQIGVKESPYGSNNVKYNTWFYGRPVHGGDYSWCATFLDWIFEQAGCGKLYPHNANAAHAQDQVAKMGSWVLKQTADQNKRKDYVRNKAKPGDIVDFNFSNLNSTWRQHTEIVVEVKGDYLVCVGGNTSGGKGSQSNGGMVAKNERHYKYVVSAARPAWPANDSQVKKASSTNASKPKAKSQSTKKQVVPTYTKGKTYTIKVDCLNVRTGPGVKYAAKKKSQLTKDGQKHANSKGQLIEGTRVTCQQINKNNGNIWMKIPSGWVCAYYQGKKYIG